MSKNQNNIPELRFPEFVGEWEKKKLGENCNVLMCKRIFANETSLNDEIPFYKIGTLGDEPDAFISRKLFEAYKEKYNYPKKGEILMTCSGTVGKCVVYNGEDAYYQDSNIVWIDNPTLKTKNEFLFYWFSNVNWGKLNSTTITRIYGSDLRNLKIIYPKTVLEQQKIATFLTSVEKRIKALEQKKELLVQYKKGVMQKIFNREIRFQPGTVTHHLPLAAEPTTLYNNNNSYPDWEVKKLGEIAVKESSNISANTLENNTGNFKIYGATGFLQNVDFFRQEEEYISIVKDGAGVGRTLLCEEKSSVLGTLDIIKPKKEVNLYFLYSVLNKINFTKYVTGSTIPHIYFKDYSKQKIEIPCLEEQQKIAGFLSAIDTKIEAVTSQIDHSKTFKKGLLQKMFV